MTITIDRSKVGVCIVTYNSAQHIRQCLLAVKRQTWPSIKIVVIDNSSSDHTIEIVSEICPDAMVTINSVNVGFAAAQNQAIRIADSDYVLVLNPDVILHEGYVTELVRCLSVNPEIGSATGCLSYLTAPHIIDSTGLEMNSARRAVERGSGRPNDEFNDGSFIFGVSGAAAMYSKKMIQAISIENQFFDEDFFAYKEDVDVAWRAHIMGWKSWYEPEAKALHGRRWGSRTGRKQIAIKVRKHSYQNRYLMIVKNERFSWRWWLNFPKLLAFEIMYHGYLSLRDPKMMFGSWPELVRLLPSALRKRKLIQALRK